MILNKLDKPLSVIAFWPATHMRFHFYEHIIQIRNIRQAEYIFPDLWKCVVVSPSLTGVWIQLYLTEWKQPRNLVKYTL